MSAVLRRALALAGCGVIGVGLTACESTEQESARIGRESETAPQAAAKPVHGARRTPAGHPARAGAGSAR